jgi:hypothetical protein
MNLLGKETVNSDKSTLLIYCDDLDSFASDLIKRINNWLKKNRKWKAISFETIAYDYESKNRRRNSLHNKGRSRNELRGLR